MSKQSTFSKEEKKRRLFFVNTLERCAFFICEVKMDWNDKEQVKGYHRKWQREHKNHVQKYRVERKEAIAEYGRNWRNNNKDAISKWWNENRALSREYRRKEREKYPWRCSYYCAKQRCSNPNKNSYKYYGGRGIEFKLTMSEIKLLWLRDKAYNMKKPTLDRRNNDGHYEFDNCQFLELIENIKKQAKQRRAKCKMILSKQS